MTLTCTNNYSRWCCESAPSSGGPVRIQSVLSPTAASGIYTLMAGTNVLEQTASKAGGTYYVNWTNYIAPTNITATWVVFSKTNAVTNYASFGPTVMHLDVTPDEAYRSVGGTAATFTVTAPAGTTYGAWTVSPTSGVTTADNADHSSTTVTPGTNAGSYSVFAHPLNYTPCSACDTNGVLNVASGQVTNIKFNWDPSSSASDAINIRQDYSNAYGISSGEWVKGGTNIPVCYTTNRAVTIKASFTVQPANITSADIWALSTDSDGSLGDVVKTNVTFVSGVATDVVFQISGKTPSCIQKTTSDLWQWKMENLNGSGSAAGNLNVSGPHTVYTILNEPVPPWDNTPANKSNAWATALNFAISSASCNGDSTESSALAHITEYLHSATFGKIYEITNGASGFGMGNKTNGTFDLTSYMTGASNIVNCADQAAGVSVCSRLLGIASDYLYMKPFGYLLTTDLVGIGACNNPFYPNEAPPYNIPLLGTNGVTDLVLTNREPFNFHVFIWHDYRIYDATCGPHLGTEDKVDYCTALIDISTLNERYDVSPDVNLNGSLSETEINAALTLGDVTGIK